MSNHAHRRHRPHRTIRPANPTRTAVMPGACLDTEAEIQAMMRQTHDGLIDMLGPSRRSGIQWRLYRGLDAARTFDTLFADDGRTDPTVLAGIDQFRAFLTEHGDRAVLVVASCQAAR